MNSDKASDSNEDNALNLQTRLSINDFMISWIGIREINHIFPPYVNIHLRYIST